MVSPVPETPPLVLAAQLSSPNLPLLIDVRTPPEFAEGHIEGAINIPLMELTQRLDELPASKEQAIVTVCSSAKRTIAATHLLMMEGYEDTRQLAGGMNAWVDAGLPTVS